MYRVILVEDEKFALNYMIKMLKGFKELTVVAAFSSPEEVLYSIDKLKADVAFLDIEMPRMNGIELARKLMEKQHKLQIVFTTAYSKYAVDAFGVEAMDYLLKPVNYQDIMRVIKRLNKTKTDYSKKQNSSEPSALETESLKSCQIRCFGCFEIKDTKNQFIKWPTKKAEEVFAYFLMHQGSYINKWELMDKFWPDMEEERGLHNLYNTIYRVKQVLKKLTASANIEKINDGYVLKSEGFATDLDALKCMDDPEFVFSEKNFAEVKSICLSYKTPLFGTRDYIWSVSLQENISRIFKRVCKRVINRLKEQDDFEQADEIIRHYVKQHPENEDMMLWWLGILKDWSGRQEKTAEYLTWFNEKLSEMELPLLEDFYN